MFRTHLCWKLFIVYLTWNSNFTGYPALLVTASRNDWVKLVGRQLWWISWNSEATWGVAEAEAVPTSLRGLSRAFNDISLCSWFMGSKQEGSTLTPTKVKAPVGLLLSASFLMGLPPGGPPFWIWCSALLFFSFFKTFYFIFAIIIYPLCALFQLHPSLHSFFKAFLTPRPPPHACLPKPYPDSSAAG